MLDRLTLTYLIHTQEIPQELRAGVIATAKRRYANYRQAVRDLLAKEYVDGAEEQRSAAV